MARRSLEAEIVRAIQRGAVEAAQVAFQAAVGNDCDAAYRLITQLGKAVRLPHSAILCGPGRLVWGNPFRTDYAWRCGPCPWTGSNYRSSLAAEKAAQRHWAEDHGGPVRIQRAGR